MRGAAPRVPAQRAAPPAWDESYCGGAWVLSAYDDVAAALRDPRFSVRRAARWINSAGDDSDAAGQARFKRVFARSLLFLDGRAHRRLREIVSPPFKPGDLHAQAPAIATLAERLAADLAARADNNGNNGNDGNGDSVDFIACFARPLPALVIARLMGIASEPPPAFIGWAADLAAFIGSPTPDAGQAARARHALADLCDFFAQAMDAGSAAAPGSLLASIAQARQELRMTRIEALAQCCTFLFAGYETTRSLLGNGLLALLRHPAQWAALKAEPARLRGAIREMLRYDSPVQYTGRRLVADVEIGGRRLRRGDLAILHIGAANHDPRRFSEPGRFDIGRDQGAHLSFGHGPHVCIGAALTQLEAEIAFRALMRALPDMTLAPGAQCWRPGAAYRALERLPLICRSHAHA